MLVTYLDIVKFTNPLHCMQNPFSANQTIILDIILKKERNEAK